jgi:hypothetical protein
MKINWLKVGSVGTILLGGLLTIVEGVLEDKKLDEKIDAKFAEKSAEKSEEEA